jgi:site-specific DNA-methyltransferase (adenine-specific)
MRRIIEWTIGTVVDPFMGSGSTGLACVITNRPFIGIEIDPSHFNTSKKRIVSALKDKRSQFNLLPRRMKG